METVNWALLGVVVIIAACAWKGQRNGFVRAVFSVFSVLLSIMGAVFIGPIIKTIFSGNAAFSYVVAFIIADIAVKIACNVLDIVAKLPVLHQINQTAGLLAGLAEGILYVWIAFIVLDVFGGTEWADALLVMVHSSELLNAVYENNLLLWIWRIL